MKQAVGKYCGDFQQPSQPFVSQPFFGHYATSGRKSGDGTTGSGSVPGTATPGPPSGNQNGGGNNGNQGGKKTQGTNGATAYDPSQYETKPQGAPPSTGGATPPGK
jgi:penicillin-binding protein 1A